MDWLIGLLLLVCGVIIGFFVGRFLGRRKDMERSQHHIEQTIKQVLSEQASAHIGECRQVLDSMSEQCQHLKQELDNYEALLQPSEDDEKSKLNFFGDQASAYLRNHNTRSDGRNSGTGHQPQDYANAGTGLFSGSQSEQSDKS